MPELLLIIAAILVGFLLGYLARGYRRPTERVVVPDLPNDPPQPFVVPPLPPPSRGLPSADPPPAATPGVDVAREVLDVADRLSNTELIRRLIEAVVLLPGIRVVRPKSGDVFQPQVHEWAGNRITEQRTQWNTIAETLAPGAATADLELLRPAHVIVFEPPE